MKKYLSLFLMVSFLFAIANIAEARIGDSRIGNVELQTKRISVAELHTHVVTGPCDIYRISFRTQRAYSWLGVFDSGDTYASSSASAHLASTLNASRNALKADIGEASAGDFVNVDYGDNPISCNDGIFVTFATTQTNGGVIYYGDEVYGVISYRSR